MLEKGTLIRVKRDKTLAWYAPEDGPLWVVDQLHPRARDAYHCKSITTGKRWIWMRDEFDVTDKEQDDA